MRSTDKNGAAWVFGAAVAKRTQREAVDAARAQLLINKGSTSAERKYSQTSMLLNEF